MLRLLKGKDHYTVVDNNLNILYTSDNYADVSSMYYELHKDRFEYFRLSTGSQKGNCDLLKFNDELILFDCGISFKSLKRLLNNIGVNPEQITAVLYSHNHKDHINPTTNSKLESLDITIIDTGDTKELNKQLKHFKFKSIACEHGPIISYAFAFIIDGDKSNQFLMFTDIGNTNALPIRKWKHIFGECNSDAKGLFDTLAGGLYHPKVASRTMRDHLSKEKLIDYINECGNSPSDVLPKHMSSNTLSCLDPFTDTNYYTFKKEKNARI